MPSSSLAALINDCCLPVSLWGALQAFFHQHASFRFSRLRSNFFFSCSANLPTTLPDSKTLCNHCPQHKARHSAFSRACICKLWGGGSAHEAPCKGAWQ